MQEPKKQQVQEAKGAVADQKPMRINASQSAIFGLAFSPDNQYIVTGSADKVICIWNCHGPLNIGNTIFDTIFDTRKRRVRSIQLPYIAPFSENNVGKVAISHSGQFISLNIRLKPSPFRRTDLSAA